MSEKAVGWHKHEFTALYWHPGRYGDQGVHIHSCFREGCDRVLIGDGRNCDPKATHQRKTLHG